MSCYLHVDNQDLHSFPTRRSSDLTTAMVKRLLAQGYVERSHDEANWRTVWVKPTETGRLAVSVFHQARLNSLEYRLDRLTKRSEEHTSELQSPDHLVCRLLLEKKK